MFGKTTFWVRCYNCSADGPPSKFRESAIELWNEPSNEMVKLDKQVDEMDADIKALRQDCERLRAELDEANGVIR